MWEYRTVLIPTGGWLGGKFDERSMTETMNDLGRDGWELVTALDTNRSGGETRHVVLLFKRKSA